MPRIRQRILPKLIVKSPVPSRKYHPKLPPRRPPKLRVKLLQPQKLRRQECLVWVHKLRPCGPQKQRTLKAKDRLLCLMLMLIRSLKPEVKYLFRPNHSTNALLCQRFPTLCLKLNPHLSMTRRLFTRRSERRIRLLSSPASSLFKSTALLLDPVMMRSSTIMSSRICKVQ